MNFFKQLFGGFSAVFSITTPPLYRYPYRNSAEALRGDMLRVGGDMHYVGEQMSEGDL